MDKKLISSKNSKNTKNAQFPHKMVNANSKYETADFSSRAGSKLSHKKHGKKTLEVAGKILPIEERDSTIETASQDTSAGSSFASVMTSIPISTTDPLMDQAIEEEIPRDDQETEPPNQDETDAEIPVTGMTLTMSPSSRVSSTADVPVLQMLPTKRKSGLSVSRVRRSELMMRGTKRVEQWLEQRQAARALSHVSVDQPIITGSKGCLADVLDQQIVLMRRRHFATQTDWSWKLMAERWRHGRIVIATVTSSTTFPRRRKEPKLKIIVESFLYDGRDGDDSVVSNLSSVADTDKCVDTSDLLLNYAHAVNAMRQHHDHLKRLTHHGKKSLKRSLAPDDSRGSQGSDDISRNDHRGSTDSQGIEEGVELSGGVELSEGVELAESQDRPDKPEGE